MSGTARAVVGIDIGGTFTDVVLVDTVSGKVCREKLLTTADPSEAVLAGVERVLKEADIYFHDLASTKYSTTVAANAVIERRGAKTALLCTKGFRDMLESRREQRYELYDLLLEYPAPLVPRRLRIGIDERMSFDGTVLRQPSREEVMEALGSFRNEGVRSIAVMFLNSYANPANELTVGKWIAEAAPDWHVSLSSDVTPQIGEYERVSTTIINAYVQPMIAEHLDRIERSFAEKGLSGRFFMMTSNGGVVNASVAKRVPARLIESGPAAGAAAAARHWDVVRGLAELGERVGGILSFDMGGTTAKSCFLAGGQLPVVDELEVARLQRHKKGSGLLLRLPSVDLIEVGSGGGSIAFLNAMGMLQVGPESAGSVPGPVCYGLGGESPTVTDADVVLGYLNPHGLLAGWLPISSDLAHESLSDLGRQFGRGPEEAAWAVIDVVTESMAEAIRSQAAELGIDARQFTMVAFGGAGPLHAGLIARRLGISRIVVPPAAGVLSAHGCVQADVATEVVLSFPRPLAHLDVAAVQEVYRKLEAEARTILGDMAVGQPVELTYFADLQCVGQRSTLSIPAPKRIASPSDMEQLQLDFHAAYARRYGRHLNWVPVQAVNWRLKARLPQGVGAPLIEVTALPENSTRSERPAFLPGRGMIATPVYQRSSIGGSWHVEGPAIVEDLDTTVLIPEGLAARLMADGSIVLERSM